jgi:predicted secreted protein
MTRAHVRAVALAAVLVTGLTACTPGAKQTVPYTADEATLAVGETLVVDFGDVNPSIGDSWELTTRPDEDVLSKGEEVVLDADEETPPGAPSHVVYEFRAKGKGTTTIGFTYSYRGTPGDELGRTDDPTPEITVTVE